MGSNKGTYSPLTRVKGSIVREENVIPVRLGEIKDRIVNNNQFCMNQFAKNARVLMILPSHRLTGRSQRAGEECTMGRHQDHYTRGPKNMLEMLLGLTKGATW